MMRTLRHFRDFMTEEQLKFLPGSLLTGQFILLKNSRGGTKEEPWYQVIEVFDQGGTWIGTIENPDWIPSLSTK